MWAELLIALVSTVISIAYSRTETLGQMDRSQRETYIRGALDKIESRFGLTIDQLNQLQDKLETQLGNLKESTRGSARLSKASQIMRDFIGKYPEYKNDINSLKNYLTNLNIKLQASEDELVKKVQNGGSVSDTQIASTGLSAIGAGNQQIRDFNSKYGGKNEPRTEEIDTNLVETPPSQGAKLFGEEVARKVQEKGISGILKDYRERNS